MERKRTKNKQRRRIPHKITSNSVSVPTWKKLPNRHALIHIFFGAAAQINNAEVPNWNVRRSVSRAVELF
ncbi:hypothetical protein YC2023_072591 [Brassica napus]